MDQILTLATGFDASWAWQLQDADGVPTEYPESAALDAKVWRGGAGPTLFSPAVAWEDADANVVKLSVFASQTEAIEPGLYRIRVGITSGGVRSEAFVGYIELRPSTRPRQDQIVLDVGEGFDARWSWQLLDADGRPTAYPADAALDAKVWRGDPATPMDLNVVWLDASADKVLLKIRADQTTQLGPGFFRLQVGITSNDLRNLAFDGTLEVQGDPDAGSLDDSVIFESELHEWLKERLGIAIWAGFIPAKKSPTEGHPALVYNLVSTEAEEELEGPSDVVAYTFQFDAYAASRKEASQLIYRLWRNLQGYIGPMGRADCLNALRGTQNHGYDILPDGSTGATQRRMVEYTIWFRETPPNP